MIFTVHEYEKEYLTVPEQREIKMISPFLRQKMARKILSDVKESAKVAEEKDDLLSDYNGRGKWTT